MNSAPPIAIKPNFHNNTIYHRRYNPTQCIIIPTSLVIHQHHPLLLLKTKTPPHPSYSSPPHPSYSSPPLALLLSLVWAGPTLLSKCKSRQDSLLPAIIQNLHILTMSKIASKYWATLAKGMSKPSETSITQSQISHSHPFEPYIRKALSSGSSASTGCQEE